MNANILPFFKRHWLQISMVLLVLLGGLLAAYALVHTAPKAPRKPPEKTARLVQTLTVSAKPHTVSLVGYGMTQAKQQVNLQARVSGTVKKISPLFVPGSRFKQGDVLLELDKTDYEIELQSAQALLAQAQAKWVSEQGNQVVAQSDFDLLKLDVSEREKALILRQPQLQSAQADVHSAQATLARAQVNLERTVLRAPFDGVVVSRDTSLGAQVSTASNLGVLASGDTLWVNLALPQTDLKWIEFPSAGKKGSQVCVSDASSNTETCHTGRVLSLQSTVQDTGRQALVLVEVPLTTPTQNAHPLLLSQYVKARIEGIRLPNVYALNPSLVHGDTVWLNKKGMLHIAPVTVAFRATDHVLISKGLNTGDEIITSNLGSPIEGMAIRIEQQKGQ